MYAFSPSTMGFYHPSVHSQAQMPNDTVNVEDADYRALMKAQEAGQMIVVDNGRPLAINRPVKWAEVLPAAVGQMLDAFAREWGYASMIDATSYLMSRVSQYAAEATALVDYRDSVWQAADPAIAAAKKGAQFSSVADFLKTLPAAPERPTS